MTTRTIPALLALLLAACGCDSSSDTGENTSCTYDGTTYDSGDTFDASDGCNTCTCSNGDVACTEKACLDSCTYDGTTYDSGDTFDASDGCNTCTCSNGDVACTLIECGNPTECGGMTENSCAKDEYCAYTDPVDLCGTADAPSVCLKRPSTCDLSLSPVCGCDGLTYDNACLAAVAGQGVLANGACE